MPPLLTLLVYVLAGLGGGLLALRTGIPAAPLAGALLGAALVSMSGRLEVAQWPSGSRTVLEIAIGTVIGTSLTSSALAELRELWRPAVLITVTLVMTGLVVGLWCSRLLGIDPVVALLGAAPGGISGMSLVGAEFGVGAAVAALHAVRLITVLLVLPPDGAPGAGPWRRHTPWIGGTGIDTVGPQDLCPWPASQASAPWPSAWPAAFPSAW